MDTDDFGSVLLRLGDRARGCFSVSQMSAGCKNRFQFEIFGSKKGVAWCQSAPTSCGSASATSPIASSSKTRRCSIPRRPASPTFRGHSEGYDDAHKQVYKRFYAKVADPRAPLDYPTSPTASGA